MTIADAGRTERTLFLIVRGGISFSIGVMVAFLYSVKAVHPDLRWSFSVGTIIAFLVTTAATWFALQLLFQQASRTVASPRESRKRWFSIAALSSVVIGGMVVAFARGIQNLPPSESREMLQGTAMAVVCLAALGVIFVIVIRFFERDHRHTIEEEQRRDADKP